MVAYGSFDCIYNVYFITFRQNERSSKVFVKNMCSQGKKSRKSITLIRLSVYKKYVCLILLFKIHKEKLKKHELTACQNNTFLTPQAETYFLHADIIANILSILGFKEASSFELVFNW